MPETLDGLSRDIEQANLDKLRAVFPECFAEGKLDTDKLLSLCGEYVDNDFEKYKFEWKGKSECLRLAQKRSAGTLRPCPEESESFDATKNLYIEGDNLEVLKLLQTAYFRSVKMIYIDPPYNTGNDFVYVDDFSDPIARYKEVTRQTMKSNPETAGRFHTNWLNMMYPRLRLAADLLRDDGVIFISVDDNEVANLRKICDEVFGEENFEGHIHWRRRHNQPNDKTKMIGLVAEHILAYAKSAEKLRTAGVGKTDLTGEFSNPDNDPRGDWASKPWKSGSDQSGSRYTIVSPTGRVFDEEWMGEEATYKELLADGRIIFPRGGDGMPRKKYFRNEREREGQCATNWWTHERFGHNQGANDCMTALFGVKNVFSNPKPVELVRGLIQIANVRDGDTVLDFFSGSATTAHAVMALNSEDNMGRRFILIQLPENLDKNYSSASGKTRAQLKASIDFLDSINKPHTISEIGKERIRRAGAKILAETAERSGTEKPSPDVGFRVFKLDTSNLKAWDGSPAAEEDTRLLAERMNDMIHRVKPERSDMDTVYEIMLKLGVRLTCGVRKIEVNGKTAYIVGEERLLLICLAEGVRSEDAEVMAEYAPAIAVVARDSFEDDTAMANTHYILADRGIELKLI
ncbi:MAG: site-specific DNA-methyltransferase [Lachnospiraceae bacterium]|nr:site-specific DNA-methyltransferase [Ruminococcus sp.]MCM1274282.1 site-specific DNA-methyltransferase [Lachnospiraceae bacterium]